MLNQVWPTTYKTNEQEKGKLKPHLNAQLLKASSFNLVNNTHESQGLKKKEVYVKEFLCGS